ncbi:cytochrome b/b6 domain-containing protein [Paracoccus sp. R12_1]|uniref:cytochrome b/b6 domain-containing protein n=1 Tax=unclassified Paracoccus (in: a-proteobacteria) TaxID=2688777 RepID=UPI001ADC2D5F|nr:MULTISPECIES: cytochrome b/b6 domain-containing protein [unclassified Paracoccus (in: a-proteobacteria)]MBO9457040.1 cytochrome b/b6 domain-containing protein [Paracoccus sp. R12_2]MBO9488293.1 cytochrome b/b6 domain-containing protein [Paracoccus sp. R12_1]
MSEDQARRVRIWDPALRFFHWALAALVVTTWILGKFGPNVMTLHFWFGYAIIALLLFRLVWGLVGPRSARFASFVRGPAAVLGYVRHLGRREPSHWPGHNPLGALSVIAMLAALAWQVGTGLISDPDDFINVGPLADKVGGETAGDAVGWHHWGATAILILVLLHVAVILFYRVWKNEDLVGPMLTGWKWVRKR